jgi:hypothetical protein
LVGDLGQVTAGLVALQVGEHGGVAAEGAGGEEGIGGGEDEVAAIADLHEGGGSGGLEVLCIPREQLQPKQTVAGDEALNLVEDRGGIEGAQARFEVVGGEPDGVAVGLAGLRATALAHVGAGAPGIRGPAEGDELAHVCAHLVGDADDHLEVAADAGAVGCLLHLLQVAIAICNRT